MTKEQERANRLWKQGGHNSQEFKAISNKLEIPIHQLERRCQQSTNRRKKT